MKERIPIIIDCDPGHDDAIALIMAFSARNLDVRAVTTTSGNQTLEKTTRNALKVLSYIDKRPLVAKGCTGPLVRPLEVAESVHGESGLDGPSIPDPTFGPQAESAWELSRKLILESSEPVTMVCTGPLTNLATLLIAYPEVRQNIRQVCLMGGGIDHGNWTTAAEFNILVDPEAADKVFSSGIPIVMCGLDVTEKAILSLDDIEEIRSMGGKVPVLVAGLLDFFSKFHLSMGFPGVPLHDPTAIAYLMRPELFASEKLYVQVETQGKLTTGMTFADKRTNLHKHQPNALVCTGIDREGFVRLVKDCCMSYNSKVLL